MNALLKNKVEYKRSELPEFLEKLKEAINEQDREVERAVINRGKYKLLPEFQSFGRRVVSKNECCTTAKAFR